MSGNQSWQKRIEGIVILSDNVTATESVSPGNPMTGKELLEEKGVLRVLTYDSDNLPDNS